MRLGVTEHCYYAKYGQHTPLMYPYWASWVSTRSISSSVCEKASAQHSLIWSKDAVDSVHGSTRSTPRGRETTMMIAVEGRGKDRRLRAQKLQHFPIPAPNTPTVRLCFSPCGGRVPPTSKRQSMERLDMSFQKRECGFELVHESTGACHHEWDSNRGPGSPPPPPPERGQIMSRWNSLQEKKDMSQEFPIGERWLAYSCE